MNSGQQGIEGIEMFDTSLNKIIYLSPLGIKGIADIKKACIFFDKVFVPVTWSTLIVSSFTARERRNKWKVSIPVSVYKITKREILKEFEPLIEKGIIETDTSPDFNLVERVKSSLDRLPKYEKECEAKRKYLGITDGKSFLQQARIKILTQIDCYSDIFGSLNYTPCFNDPLALDVIGKCINFYERYEETSKSLSMIKSELGLKKDILTLNVIGENFPSLFHIESRKILKVRKKLEPQLDYFRAEMDKYCIEIQNQPYSSEFVNEIQRVIKGKINPLIMKLKKEIETSKDEFIVNLFKSIPTIKTGATFGLSVFAGLPVWLAFGIASGVAFINSLVEHEAQLRKIKRKNGLGIFLSAREEREKNEFEVSKKAEKIKSKAVFMFEKGLSFSEQHYHKKALKAYDKAIEINPNLAEIWNNKGHALSELGRNEEALEAFDYAIKLNPYLDEVHNKSSLLIELNRNEEALESCQSVIEINPNNAKVWNNKSHALYKLKRYKEALEAIERFIKLNPSSSKAWYNKACLYSILGDKEKALENLSKAINLDSKNKEEAKKDDDFKKLWGDDEFIKITS
jgi:tetratricopeptide (TPR) repeat protein